MTKNEIGKPRKILCYIDFSEKSHVLVEYAFGLSRLFEAELFVLHSVMDIRKAAGFYVPHINTDLLEGEVVQGARDKMYAICRQASGDGIDLEHRLITQGSPIEDINRTIGEKGIDLLVLSHEMSRGTLSGFRSDYVEKFMKEATIPFLVIPVR